VFSRALIQVVDGGSLNLEDNMAFSAIPTTYSGVNFRSRLEARWAATFDLLDWEWEYEPFDCEGWIPDFLLRGATPMLIEVKPVISAEECEPFRAEIVKASPPYPVAVIGCSPFPSYNCRLGAFVWDPGMDNAREQSASLNAAYALLRDKDPLGATIPDVPCPCGETSCSCGNWSADLSVMRCAARCVGLQLSTEVQGWLCQRCGDWGKHNFYDVRREFDAVWKQAGNMIQWKARR